MRGKANPARSFHPPSVSARLVNENTRLTGEVKTNTDLLDEIHLHVANIGKKVGAEMGRFAPGRPPPDTSTSS